MKRILILSQILLFILFFITVCLAVIELTGPPFLLSKFNFPSTKFKNDEVYDPSLNRLNSITRIEAYCDSLTSVAKKMKSEFVFESEYPQIVSEVIRKRFYHGMSSYGFGDNYMAYIGNKFTGMLLNAPVLVDDILKHPYAICSQQALVAMKLLDRKNISNREIHFDHDPSNGHFCYEAFYQGQWHFFDTDKEPDISVLMAYNRPDINFFASNPEILIKAYPKVNTTELTALFSTHSYGVPGQKHAPNATIFQQVTKFFSYTIWILFLFASLLVRRKYRRITQQQYVRNSRFSIPNLQQGRSSEDFKVFGSSGA